MSKILLFFLFVSTLVFIAVGTDAADGSEGGKREVDFYSVFPFVRPSVRKRLTNRIGLAGLYKFTLTFKCVTKVVF